MVDTERPLHGGRRGGKYIRRAQRRVDELREKLSSAYAVFGSRD
ncbi:hypothetical protein ACFSKT_00010 [Paenibacillus xanthanilyticus]